MKKDQSKFGKASFTRLASSRLFRYHHLCSISQLNSKEFVSWDGFFC